MLQRTREERRLGSNAEPLLNDMVSEGSSFNNLQKDETHPVEVYFKYNLCKSFCINLFLGFGRKNPIDRFLFVGWENVKGEVDYPIPKPGHATN